MNEQNYTLALGEQLHVTMENLSRTLAIIGNLADRVTELETEVRELREKVAS